MQNVLGVRLGYLPVVVLVLISPSASVSKEQKEESKIENIYTEAHLLELARGIGRVRKHAAENVSGGDRQDEDIPDTQKLETEAGILLYYTISLRTDEEGKKLFHHHLSISRQEGCYLATSYAQTLLAYIHRILGLSSTCVFYIRSSKGISHMAFFLDHGEHRKFCDQPVEIPPKEKVKDILVKSMIEGGKIRFNENCSRAGN